MRQVAELEQVIAEGEKSKHVVLREVLAWLMTNSLRSENKQFTILAEQSLANIWRKNAYAALAKQVPISRRTMPRLRSR